MSNTESTLRIPFNPESLELECRVWTNHGKTYVAKLVGPHPQYKVERQFVDYTSAQVSRTGKNGTKLFTLSGPGLYEVSSPDTGLYDHAAKLWFELSADGKIEELTKGEAFRRAQALKDAPVSEAAYFEECYECGATYSEPGHVWDGGMQCSRCQYA